MGPTAQHVGDQAEIKYCEETSVNSNQGDNRLPLFATVREAYALVFLNCGAFIRIAWAWLIVLSALVAVASWFFWPSHAAALEAGDVTSWVQTQTV